MSASSSSASPNSPAQVVSPLNNNNLSATSPGGNNSVSPAPQVFSATNVNNAAFAPVSPHHHVVGMSPQKVSSPYPQQLDHLLTAVKEKNTPFVASFFAAYHPFSPPQTDAAATQDNKEQQQTIITHHPYNGSPANFVELTSGLSLLHWCVVLDACDIAAILLRNGATVWSFDPDGFTPIHRAAWRGSTAMMRVLLGLPPLPTGTTTSSSNGHSSSSSSKGEQTDTELRAPLPEQLPSQDLKNCVNFVHSKTQRTPLILAAIRGDVAMCRLLVVHGSDVDWRDAAGNSAVDHAAKAGRKDVVHYLMHGAGADCDRARAHTVFGSDKAKTVAEREAFQEINRMLCAVWAPQSVATIV